MSLFVDSVDVKILSDSLVLYGKGNKLFLVCCEKSMRVKKLKISTYDKIHKISFTQKDDGIYRVACAAGKELLLSDIVDNEFENSRIVKLSDWISSTQFIQRDLAIMTAHSQIAILNKDDKIYRKIHCDETSTLYCSFIYVESSNQLLFFGGTALGELLVWTEKKTIFRQFLHNGVIFSIDYNGTNLVTSSDDRSIKVFDIDHTGGLFHLTEKKQLFGHISRVFACKVISFDQSILFLSAGEDSSLCVWNEEGELLSKKNVSSSGILWNLDYCERKETVVTCSSSGKLNSFKLRDILFEKHYQMSFNDDIHPVKLKFLENGLLVVLDSKMDIHVKTKKGDSLKINQPNSLRKIVAIDVFKNRLFLAAKNSVVVFDYYEDQKELKFSVEVDVKRIIKLTIDSNLRLDYLRSIHAISSNEVVLCDASGLCNVFDIRLEKITTLFKIPQSAEPWTTAVEKLGEFWLVGDRVGNLFSFKSSSTRTVSSPLQKLWKLHGHLGVTNIKATENGFITTTGNGTVKTLFFDRTKNPPSIEIYKSEKMCVNWIEKTCVLNGKEFFLGFNDNYFVIQHKRQIVYEQKCGGRHRHWDFTTDGVEQKAVFSYIQKKQLKFVEFLISDFEFFSKDTTWHTRECNAIENVNNLLISGGEDTTLKLMKIVMSEDDLKLEEAGNVYSHISSIKTIATAEDGDDLLIFSAGGRAQINITRLINFGHEVTWHIKEELSFLLSKQSKDSIFDPETRFTSIFYDAKLNNLFVVSSDGFIRVFVYAKNSLIKVLEHYYGKCLLKIHVLGQLILTMGTDGFVCFWLYNENAQNLKLVEKLKHNQSGINCFDIWKITNNVFTIATGGDDTGIFVTKLHLVGSRIEFSSTIFTNSVHTAQVTGIKFLNPDVICSTSIDQTLCTLQIHDSTIKVIDKKYTCVADVKGLTALKTHIGIYGAGLEFISNVH